MSQILHDTRAQTPVMSLFAKLESTPSYLFQITPIRQKVAYLLCCFRNATHLSLLVFWFVTDFYAIYAENNWEWPDYEGDRGQGLKIMFSLHERYSYREIDTFYETSKFGFLQKLSNVKVCKVHSEVTVLVFYTR